MKKPPFVRSLYNYDADLDARETGLKCEDESLAKQQFAEECDINTIVKRFGLDYKMPPGVPAPDVADFTAVTDFHSAMEAIVRARESFDTLPAQTRAMFANDPGSFVDFCADERNRPVLESWGLVVKPAAPAVQPAATAPAAASSSTQAAAATKPS